ncbi:MAG TPA: hypothetical protein VMB05_03265 [Solirubrobacteraceae bacterium]|nr:hypothetical protein [Solirubrobacteraceae bacterium]
MKPTACFVSASRQNVFFGELQDALAETLAAEGIEVTHAVDCFPSLREGLAYVFVPHELLPFIMPDARPNAEQLRRSVAICTEQPGTHWFDETAQVAAQVAAALDINSLGVQALRRCGVAARLLQLGYTSRWDRWHQRQTAPREIDVTLLAGATPRRLTAIARCGRHLAGRRTELHLPEALVPHGASSEQFISGERKWELLARSKLLLNIHRGELGYFEWQRAVEAIANGCVLLSEHSLGFEPLVPGEHFVSCSYESLDVALQALLEDEDRLARMRDSAYRLLRDLYPLRASAPMLAEAIEQAACTPLRPGLARAGDPVPRPSPPQLPPPAWELIAPSLTDDRTTAPPATRARAGDEADGSAELFGTHTRTQPPRVTVLLAGAAGSMAGAVRALSLSEYEQIELVLVDRSDDEPSFEEALGPALADAPWICGSRLTVAPSLTVGDACNRGLELAHGELILLLAAETELYPHALGRLVDTLDRRKNAAFAYGAVELHNVGRPEGLDGYLGWEPYRLRYGSFINGLALIRRSTVLQVGGFVSDPALDGWEELALWCALADRDEHGVRVPEILARRRSPILRQPAAAERDPATAWRVLRRQYAGLSRAFDG